MRRKTNKRGLAIGLLGVASAGAVLAALTVMPLRPKSMDMGLSAAPKAPAVNSVSAASAVAYTQYQRETAIRAPYARLSPRVPARPAVRPVVRQPAQPFVPLPVVSPQLASLTATSDCTLTVPANPLSAAGLMTPYMLSNGNDGTQCAENNQTTAAFVQAVILDPATGALSVYDPVVTDAANPQVTAPPVTLPRNAVVTIWTGFNDNVLKLAGPGAGQFVNFAQQSYANSPLFFAWLRFDVARGLTKVPAIGTSPADGMACPTVRDFSVVDQDQSDNVPVSYGAPFNVSNGSDDDLLTLIDNSLGCTPWEVTLQDPGVTATPAMTMTTAGPLEEVQAALMQPAPQALVPGLDPFVTLNAKPDLFLQNLYRAQVGQPFTFNDHDTTAYCQNLAAVGEPRLKADATAEAGFPAPSFAMIGTNLANVLAARYAATWANLTCPALTGMTSPITVTTDASGIAISAAYGVSMPVTATAAATPSVTPSVTPTVTPSVTPTVTPTDTPTVAPTDTSTDTATPTVTPTG